MKNSTLPLRKIPIFQGVASGYPIFTSFCVILLWDSATAHSPSGQNLHPSSQEDARFSGCCTLAYNFHFILHYPSLGLCNSSSPSDKNAHFSGRCNLAWKFFTLSCVIPLWDSATAHSSSGKELNPSSQEGVRFSGRCTFAYKFHFILRHHFLGLSNSSLTLR